MLQVRGALLDFDDQYQITEIGVFSARYGHFATWELHPLLSELAGQQIDVRSARDDFHGFLAHANDSHG